MSDFSIPGVSSKYNTDKMIDDLMKLERIPLTRAEERIENFELQKRNWQEINRGLARVQDSAKKLFGFENPFMERIAVSGDESIVGATASREAVEENRSVLVKQVATADRFLSDSLENDFRVAKGTYSFSIGDKEFSFSYSGGTLTDFASTLQRRSNGLLRSSVVKNTPSTQVLMIEGTRTGSSNKINFLEDSRDFALKTGTLKKAAAGMRRIEPSEDTIQSSAGADSGTAEISGDAVTLGPSTRREMIFSPAITPADGFVLEFTVEIEKLPEGEYQPPEPPGRPDSPDPGGVTVDNVTVHNFGTDPALPAWKAPPPPEKTLDMNILSLNQEGRSVGLPPLKDQAGTQTIRVPLNEGDGRINSLIIDNINTHRKVSVSAVTFYDPDSRGDLEAKNPVATASDALIEIDGIEVIRESNDIDDVIQGVTLNLRRPGNQEVDLRITPDRETAKDTIIEFVGYYNQLISQINIYTSRDDSVVNELDYLSDDERDSAMEKLGLFQGESSLTQMKTRLQRIMMDPYSTRSGSELSLLAQIGISTNSRTGGALRTSRLRGYLEIDESALDKALETRLESVKDLFGYDSDGDLIVDQGAAVAVDNYIRPYVQTGGIIAYKTSAIDGQIDRTSREIVNLERSLERKEQQLRREYGMMEGALQQLEDNSKALENFNNRNRD
ncbi:flagellar filament capping protein FliD [Marispirochaeta sp.]|jgi:flagellar hook-associated protein 2|uniref:flagellar filament capping protein FliD n=1 Tax=Marispirochaeta sp. TaxID=2038653 RepID=UPI0029C722D9|nr:flagellar filament capping protein FliD [Marispirochaeta sp.]